MKLPEKTRRIAIPHKNEYIFVSVADIMHLEANGAYTRIFVNDGKSYMVSRNIKDYEELLPADMFCRVHHSHIVNLDYIKTYHKGRGGYIEMRSGISIEVSVRKKDEFLARFR